jgi:muconolactone delta-isomerase
VVAVFVMSPHAASTASTQEPAKDNQAKVHAGTKWEYRVLSWFSVEENGSLEKELNKLGDENWEVVSLGPMVSAPGSGTGSSKIKTELKIILKRPKPYCLTLRIRRFVFIKFRLGKSHSS